MRSPIAIVTLAMSVSASSGADNRRPTGANCTLQSPPAEAGELAADGEIIRVFPRAKDIGARYTGCQVMFAELGQWVVVSLTEVVEGDPVRIWSEHAPSEPLFSCRYRNGKVVLGDPANCPTPLDRLLVKSLPAGCIKLIRESHAKNGPKAPSPPGCVSE